MQFYFFRLLVIFFITIQGVLSSHFRGARLKPGVRLNEVSNINSYVAVVVIPSLLINSESHDTEILGITMTTINSKNHVANSYVVFMMS